MIAATIAVTASTEALRELAEQFAYQHGLAFISDLNNTDYSYLLVFNPEYLGIQKPKDKHFKPFYIDFTTGKMLYRSEHAGLRKEMLARALGVKPSENAYIIDATAGLGRDSYILASLGFEITLLERSPIIFALLQDALKRASLTQANTINRMHLIHADTISWLSALPSKPDIIYLDPMFPERQKSASVKKEMAILQDLLGKDSDCDKLFKTALTCARKRVVVKRPRLAPPLAAAPSFSLQGKSSRFDIYLK